MQRIILPEDLIDARDAARECEPRKSITPQMRDYASNALMIAASILGDAGEGVEQERESIQVCLNTVLIALSVLIGDESTSGNNEPKKQ